jgi:hypothetical protein
MEPVLIKEAGWPAELLAYRPTTKVRAVLCESI